MPKIVLFGQPSKAKRKAGRPPLGWVDVVKIDLREMGTSREGVKREALNRNLDGGRACVAVLASGVLVLQ